MRRRHRGRSVATAAALAAVALAGAACSSGSTTSAGGSSSTTSPTGSATTGSSSTTRPAGTSTSTTAHPAGPGTCQPTQLSFSPQAGGGAAGTIAMKVVMVNVSSATCTLQGFPGMQLLDAQGGKLPTNVVRGAVSSFPAAAANAPPALVTLAPHATAAYTLTYEDVPVGSETSCPTSAKAEITPPNDYGYAVVPFQATACGGGTIHVSPVYQTA